MVNATYMRINSSRIDEIALAAKAAARPSKTFGQMRDSTQRDHDNANTIKILSAAGIDTSMIYPTVIDYISSKFWRQQLVLGEPLMDESYASHDSNNAPKGFWGTLPGFLEAKKRYDKFVRNEGRVPFKNEIEQVLKLHAFVQICSRKGVDNIHKLFGGAGLPRGNDARRHIRTAASSIASEVATTIATDSRTKSLKAVARSHQPKLVMTKEMFPSMHLYGISMEAPEGFWASELGYAQAAKRIDWFINHNHRNPRHLLPNPIDMERRLGLVDFIDEYARTHYGERDILKGLGFRPGA